MFALLLEPAVWAIGLGSAYFGTLLHDKVTTPQVAQGAVPGMQGNSLLVGALIGVGAIIVYKKVLK